MDGEMDARCFWESSESWKHKPDRGLTKKYAAGGRAAMGPGLADRQRTAHRDVAR